jgi:Ricin-type beta-trefoil lectin domain-like
VMDVAGENTAPGTQVFAWPWNGNANQRWRFLYLA